MRFCVTAVALVATLASQARGGQLYRFTSIVDVVLTHGVPIPTTPFVHGQSVVGTFRYSPELALLLGAPSGGTADYRSAFSELKLAIKLGVNLYRFTAPDASSMPAVGFPLNAVSIDDNVPIGDGGHSDGFRLTHHNLLFAPGQPMGAVDPASKVGAFYPASFGAHWSTDTLPAQSALPSFITDFSLPAGLNELFPRSANDNWALRFDELPPLGASGMPRSFQVLGRMMTLQVIPEPCGAALVGVGVILMAAAQRGRGSLRRAI
jgi:hypothetical protein